ncbi:MAG TPA: hypothetical protein VIQ30_00655 [Pseudonocardia sp.]
MTVDTGPHSGSRPGPCAWPIVVALLLAVLGVALVAAGFADLNNQRDGFTWRTATDTEQQQYERDRLVEELDREWRSR